MSALSTLTCETCRHWEQPYEGGPDEGRCEHVRFKYVWFLHADEIEFRTPPGFWCAEYDKKQQIGGNDISAERIGTE